MPFTYLCLSPIFVCLAGVLQSHKTKPWLNVHFCSPGEIFKNTYGAKVAKIISYYYFCLMLSAGISTSPPRVNCPHQSIVMQRCAQINKDPGSYFIFRCQVPPYLSIHIGVYVFLSSPLT